MLCRTSSHPRQASLLQLPCLARRKLTAPDCSCQRWVRSGLRATPWEELAAGPIYLAVGEAESDPALVAQIGFFSCLPDLYHSWQFTARALITDETQTRDLHQKTLHTHLQTAQAAPYSTCPNHCLPPGSSQAPGTTWQRWSDTAWQLTGRGTSSGHLPMSRPAGLSLCRPGEAGGHVRCPPHTWPSTSHHPPSPILRSDPGNAAPTSENPALN